MRFPLKKRMVIIKVPPYKKRMLLSLITIGFIVLTAVASYWMVDYLIRPSLSELAGVRAKQIAVENINRIIQTRIVPDLEYGELVELKLTGDGRVAYLQPKTGAINRIAVAATLAVQQCLNSLPRETVKIPLGQVLGFRTLASFGPLIPVRIIPLGIVESSVKDRFDSVGINQVRHKVFIRIKTTIKMVVPLVREEIIVNTDVPLAEAIVMGEVPDFYLGGGGLVPPNLIRKKEN